MILYWKHSVGSTCSFQIAAIDLLKECSVQIGCINLIFSWLTDEGEHFRIWTSYLESGAGTQTILPLKTPSKKTLVLWTGYNTGKRLLLYAFLYRSIPMIEDQCISVCETKVWYLSTNILPEFFWRLEYPKPYCSCKGTMAKWYIFLWGSSVLEQKSVD